MTQIIVLPHEEICPDGAVIDANPCTSICDALLGSGIELEHACENPVPAQPVTFMFVKDMIPLKRRPKTRTITSTKPGD